MQSVEQNRQSSHAEFHVVLLDGLKPSASEWRRAAVGTSLFHLLLLLILISIPKDAAQKTPHAPKRVYTRLLDPPTRLTQRARNQRPVSPDISVAPAMESPRKVEMAKVQPRKRIETPPPVTRLAKHNSPPAVPQDPPRLKTTPQQNVQLALPPVVAPPPPAHVEPPKIVLENIPPALQPGHGTGLLKVPSGGVDEAVRELSRSNATPSRTVGDDTTDDLSGSPAARPKTSLELVSDPQGIDMKPYLLEVLQNVRRNWLTIYPEGARLGLRGRVVVQFAIAPDGKIVKTVYISQARANALNEASIAALTMSDPLPQLPAGFKGDRVVLQFTFLYNAPTNLRR